MTTDKPLSYLSSTCVLQYLDPNLRFRLSQRCPSLRSAEKSVPLKIDSLAFGPADFEMNGTALKMSIIRHYPNEETPINIDTGDPLGKVQYDVDEYGFPVLDGTVKRATGEVFSDSRPSKLQAVRERNWRDEFEWRRELMQSERKLMEYMNPQTPEFLRVGERNLIKYGEATLLPFDLLRNNRAPPFSHYLELTIAMNGVIKGTELLVYNKSIYEAMKYLIWNFFARRQTAVKVNTLRISFEGVLRFPLELKLKIKNLRIESNGIKYLDSIVPTLHPESFPLESVEIDGNPPFEHQIIQEAQKVILLSDLPSFMFRTIFHRRVHSSSFGIQTIIWLIENWIRAGRDMGTCFSFEINQLDVEQALEKVRTDIRGQFGEIEEIKDTRYPRCVVEPMRNNLCEINLYCVEETHSLSMMLKVQPRGFARILDA